ncbi:hypothetical protein ACAB91_004667 [Vibrio parahaemolyticus]|nr:hypothetical protein [Vibrio parahaemolyticus]
MENILTLFISITTGFIGSLLVVMFLYQLKPKIQISNFIALNEDSTYEFKIVNNTPYSVSDLKIELFLVTPINTPNGQTRDLKSLHSESVYELDGKKDRNVVFGRDFIFRFSGDLNSCWYDKNQNLLLVVKSKHTLSQFSSVEHKSYYKKAASIKSGQFNVGGDLDVVKNA